MLVPPERFEHVGEAPTHQKMIADFATIVGPMEGAHRCGEKVGDDPEIWGAVAELLILGTRSCDPNGAALEGIRRICPTVIPITFWIFRHTDQSCDDKVYRELFNCFEACPRGENLVELDEFAVKSLRHVSRTLAMDDEYNMKGVGKGKGATKSNCSHRTGSSEAGQVEGSSQGKGSQSIGQS
jgi:hypothetical protein